MQTEHTNLGSWSLEPVSAFPMRNNGIAAALPRPAVAIHLCVRVRARASLSHPTFAGALPWGPWGNVGDAVHRYLAGSTPVVAVEASLASPGPPFCWRPNISREEAGQ